MYICIHSMYVQLFCAYIITLLSDTPLVDLPHLLFPPGSLRPGAWMSWSNGGLKSTRIQSNMYRFDRFYIWNLSICHIWNLHISYMKSFFVWGSFSEASVFNFQTGAPGDPWHLEGLRSVGRASESLGTLLARDRPGRQQHGGLWRVPHLDAGQRDLWAVHGFGWRCVRYSVGW